MNVIQYRRLFAGPGLRISLASLLGSASIGCDSDSNADEFVAADAVDPMPSKGKGADPFRNLFLAQEEIDGEGGDDDEGGDQDDDGDEASERRDDDEDEERHGGSKKRWVNDDVVGAALDIPRWAPKVPSHFDRAAFAKALYQAEEESFECSGATWDEIHAPLLALPARRRDVVAAAIETAYRAERLDGAKLEILMRFIARVAKGRDASLPRLESLWRDAPRLAERVGSEPSKVRRALVDSLADTVMRKGKGHRRIRRLLESSDEPGVRRRVRRAFRG